jgi:hypothetical protein
MRKCFYKIAVILLLQVSAYGQSPDWAVNESRFEYTMTFVAFLNSDGIGLVNTNDKVAAFINGECRGVTNVIYAESGERYCAYLTIFANENNETVSFKIYDSVNNVVKSINKTIPFKINEHYGNLFQAYSFANPALESGAEILDLSFTGIAGSNIVIESSQITIYLDQAQDKTALNANFLLSTGASVYIGTVKQVSGANELDFTNPIVFNVLSEDQSIIKQWTIVVKTASQENRTYYKKDAVCYEGGAIKVLFPIENEEVFLSVGGIFVDKQIINNGEVVFNNLNEGTYSISVAGNFKEIIINLKK